jgi:Domain of unknown function (DUF4390)
MQWPALLHRQPTARTRRWALLPWLMLVLWLALATPRAQAQAQAPATELTSFELSREDGLQIGFAVQFELPRAVDDALQKGVPLYFVAQAEVFRSRWYWRDKRVALAERTWRLAFQPLSRKFRVSFGGLNQSFDSLADALAALRRVSAWKVAEAGALEPGSSHYVEFSYRLDTSLLPRPLQIGLGGQADWNLQVEKVVRID